jgi:hypothetical protein
MAGRWWAKVLGGDALHDGSSPNESDSSTTRLLARAALCRAFLIITGTEPRTL